MFISEPPHQAGLSEKLRLRSNHKSSRMHEENTTISHLQISQS